MGKLFLIGLFIIDGNTVHSGQNDEHVRVDQLSKLCGSEILVNNGRRSDEFSVLFNNGDTAAADCDDDMSVTDQAVDHVLLNNVDRLRGRNDLTVTASGVLDHRISLFLMDLVSLFLCIESADRLGGMLERRILLIDKNLCHNGRDGLFDSALHQLVADTVLKMISDISLAHRTALRKRHRGFDGACFSSCGHSEVNHANLRSVPVRDDNVVPGFDKINDRRRSSFNEFQLLRGRIAESVSAKSDNNFRHNFRSLSLFFFSISYFQTVQ